MMQWQFIIHLNTSLEYNNIIKHVIIVIEAIFSFGETVEDDMRMCKAKDLS